MTSRGAKRGFTLIELLVVIAIIAILAAILFPVFLRAKEAGNRGVCIGNLRQLSTAAMMYADSFNGYYPPWRPGSVSYRWPFGDWAPTQQEMRMKNAPRYGLRALVSYVKNLNVFFCPSGAITAQSAYWSDGTIVYAGYCYWANYITGPLTNKIVAVNVGRYPKAFLMSDIIITLNRGPTTLNNHRQGEMPEGGAILYNDGHIKWKNFPEMTNVFSVSNVNGEWEFYM